MKKLILLLTITSLLLSCSNGGNSSSSNNNNSNSFTNSMDYEFTITINGEVHKVKGNTTNGIPKGSVNGIAHYINNECEVLNSTAKVVLLKINDVTATNYISGQNLDCQIQFPNLLIGSNQVTVYFNGGYFQTLATNLGTLTQNFIFQTTSGGNSSIANNKLPINITDLGTISANSNGNGGSNYNQYVFGETLKGNYSGTIYLQNNTNGQFTIPVQLSIDFKALRMY